MLGIRGDIVNEGWIRSWLLVSLSWPLWLLLVSIVVCRSSGFSLKWEKPSFEELEGSPSVAWLLYWCFEDPTSAILGTVSILIFTLRSTGSTCSGGSSACGKYQKKNLNVSNKWKDFCILLSRRYVNPINNLRFKLYFLIIQEW